MEVYSIKYEDKYIVYRPLVGIAFTANAALVNRIYDYLEGNQFSDREKEQAWYVFLDENNFFVNDPPLPPKKSCENKQLNMAVLCLTTKCNLRCTYCYADGGTKPIKELSLEAGCQAIEYASDSAGKNGFSFFKLAFHGGGEPTMAFDKMKSFVKYGKSMPIRCHTDITTNGCWSKEVGNWILENIDSICVSFDGIKLVQNSQRPFANGRGSFESVMNTIMLLDQNQKDYGIRVTVTDASIEYLCASVELICQNSNCRSIMVEPSFNYGRAKSQQVGLTMNDAFISEFMSAFEIALNSNCHLYYSGARPWLVSSSFCSASSECLVVTPENTLSACYEVCDSEHSLSSLFYYGCITKDGIFEFEKAKEARFDELVAQRQQECRSCFNFWHCAGDCPAKIFDYDTFKIKDTSDRCYINREITKNLLLYGINNGCIIRPEHIVNNVSSGVLK